ncbi:MAG: hypothetical protein E6J80_01740 [Deltaproteobacteria bacterium]|nr:MAG: hypothetical protein E6J80_01740 [Deltaproteobacteria bacterium]
MSRTYNVIDSDGHVLEPPDFWAEYMDPAYRERAPQLFVDTDGKERLRIEGKVLGGPTGLGFAGAIGARQGAASINIKYIEGRKGGFDPHARIPDMDLDGIDAAFLYPSLGLFSGAVEDPQLAAAMCRAYNRWLADYCQPYPDRLFGVAMLPMQSVELAIEEMCYARNELGMRSGFLRPNPYNNRMLNHPAYDPLESGGGWIAPWLDRMDRHFEDGGVFDDSSLRLRPSEYFRRQCWISFEPVEGSLAYLAEYLGPHKILWATDYPHPDGFFPGAPAMIAEKLSAANKRKVLAEGALQFYKLT